MAQLKAVGIPRNFYNKRQQISQSLETIHSSGFVGAAGADASRTLSVDDLTNKGYRIMSVTFSCTASDSGSGTLSFQVNDEEIQSYSTDTAARTFAATYFIRDWSRSHKIEIESSGSTTLSNFVIEARVKYEA